MLDKLKAKINEGLEIAGKATEGPWYHNDCTGIWFGEKQQTDKQLSLFVAGTSNRNDNYPQPDFPVQIKTAKFIAYSRTAHPAALKALLVAVEPLNKISILRRRNFGEHPDERPTVDEWTEAFIDAEQALTEIAGTMGVE